MSKKEGGLDPSPTSLNKKFSQASTEYPVSMPIDPLQNTIFDDICKL